MWPAEAFNLTREAHIGYDKNLFGPRAKSGLLRAIAWNADLVFQQNLLKFCVQSCLDWPVDEK
jgi:hypothetical protein